MFHAHNFGKPERVRNRKKSDKGRRREIRKGNRCAMANTGQSVYTYEKIILNFTYNSLNVRELDVLNAKYSESEYDKECRNSIKKRSTLFSPNTTTLTFPFSPTSFSTFIFFFVSFRFFWFPIFHLFYAPFSLDRIIFLTDTVMYIYISIQYINVEHHFTKLSIECVISNRNPQQIHYAEEEKS